MQVSGTSFPHWNCRQQYKGRRPLCRRGNWWCRFCSPWSTGAACFIDPCSFSISSALRFFSFLCVQIWGHPVKKSKKKRGENVFTRKKINGLLGIFLVLTFVLHVYVRCFFLCEIFDRRCDMFAASNCTASRFFSRLVFYTTENF